MHSIDSSWDSLNLESWVRPFFYDFRCITHPATIGATHDRPEQHSIDGLDSDKSATEMLSLKKSDFPWHFLRQKNLYQEPIQPPRLTNFGSDARLVTLRRLDQLL